MIKKISGKIATKMKIPDGLDTEMLAYGLEMFFVTLLSAVLILTISFAFGYGIEMLIYLLSFGTLRMSAGGYHCKSHLSCFISYFIMSLMGISFIHMIPSFTYTVVIAVFLTVSMILIYIFAPTQTPNRPIYPKERVRFRKRSIRLALLFIVVVWIFIILKLWILALTVTIAVFTESLTLIQIKKSKFMEEL